MTEAFPCASKHGATYRTTGPEPAGGSAAGRGRCPQTSASGRGVCAGAGCAKAAGARTHAAAVNTPSRWNISLILDRGHRLSALSFNRRKRPNLGIWIPLLRQLAACLELSRGAVCELAGVEIHLDLPSPQVAADEFFGQRILNVTL